ncbi:BTB/POZ domain-containing protein POB1-like [Gastrolobium bilobum]|uniref:BTB/POZ domain-containing protein POB1-like n=1 Tax=Gastrolobium bilobum TaxID=150636 RepID=UPI002AB08966|nr:BTB/POZ domain-containing protein POB1-like [Gastrolobium bilobum]
MDEKHEDEAYYECDFAFAFNDSNFSDRVLTIEVMPDPDPLLIRTQSHSLTLTTISPNRKRRTHPLTKDDEDSHGNDSLLGMSWSKVLQVRTIHISSPILAAKSPFFYKLFSNGMKESEQQNVTLRIHASEEAAVLDLLNFMYSNTLSRTKSAAAVLDVLMAADKFHVESCIRYCSWVLRKMPMTCETALLYLDLPSSILMSDAIQPLIDTAKLFFATNYRDITKFAYEALNFPLAAIEAVLSSDCLQVPSQDAVYEFVLKWATIHYPKLEERQDVIGSRLSRLIRFPYMSCRKLKKVLTCKDFHPHLASKFVLEALFFKALSWCKDASPFFRHTGLRCIASQRVLNE